MSRDTEATLWGLAIVACGFATLVALIAGPGALADMAGGVWDEFTRLRRVVIPWP